MLGDYLEELATQQPEFKARPDGTRINVALSGLKNYTANLVGPWIENTPKEVLEDFVKTDMFKLVYEAVIFADEFINDKIDPAFFAAWGRFKAFVFLLRNKETEHPEVCYVGMFFAAIVLERYFVLLDKGHVDPDEPMEMDVNSFAPWFISSLMSRIEELPFSFEIRGKVLDKVGELPSFLDELSRWTRR